MNMIWFKVVVSHLFITERKEGRKEGRRSKGELVLVLEMETFVCFIMKPS
jgi:hypothetical protein